MADDGAATPLGLGERPYLTWDGSGRRAILEESGFKFRSRLTQFYQGMPSGDGDSDFRYGGKVDFSLRTDLSKLGLWQGLSFTAKAEYNFGQSVIGRGGTASVVNTALAFPGINGADAFDISSFYFSQSLGSSGSLLFGKINMIDLSAGRLFAGGAGIDSYWNIAFAAPPSGVVPPYLFGAILSYRTKNANYGLWVYDPVDCVNRSCLESPFAEGVTIRGNIELPVTIGGLPGHHGFAALYSTYEGTDLESLDGIILPPTDPTKLKTKGPRYYFNYTFDQYLYKSSINPDEHVGLFGQISISDGNPTRLYLSGHIGVSGTGMIPGRSNDTWGLGYYYYGFSEDLKNAVRPGKSLRDEQGFEIFYNFEVTPWFILAANLQIIEPAASDETAAFFGLRTVWEF